MPRSIALRTPSALAVLAGVALAAGPAAASGSGPSPQLKLARAALLRQRDLGSGWSIAAPAPKHVAPVTCHAFNPRVPGASVLAGAASPTFGQSSGGPYLGEFDYVYARPALAHRVFSAVARPGLERCLKQAFQSGSGDGVTLKATGAARIPAPRVAASAAAYRVSGTASRPGQSADAYLDVLLLQRGRLMAELSCSSFNAPCPSGLEARVARAAVTRLGQTK